MATEIHWLLDEGEWEDYGYSPGRVEGQILENDLFQILWFLKGFQNSFHLMDNEVDGYYDDYTWKCEAQTHFLYDSPDRDDFDWRTQRIVSGAFGVQDELGWLGFAATFGGEYLHTMAIEVDTEWFNIVDWAGWQAPTEGGKRQYKVYRATYDHGNCKWMEELHQWH